MVATSDLEIYSMNVHSRGFTSLSGISAETIDEFAHLILITEKDEDVAVRETPFIIFDSFIAVNAVTLPRSRPVSLHVHGTYYKCVHSTIGLALYSLSSKLATW